MWAQKKDPIGLAIARAHRLPGALPRPSLVLGATPEAVNELPS